jgi:hypothetical protein
MFKFSNEPNRHGATLVDVCYELKFWQAAPYKRQSETVTLYYVGPDGNSGPRESDRREEAFLFQTLAEAIQIRDRWYSGQAEIVDLNKPAKGKTPAISVGVPGRPQFVGRQPDMQGRRPSLTPKQLAKAVKKTKKEEK